MHVYLGYPGDADAGLDRRGMAQRSVAIIGRLMRRATPSNIELPSRISSDGSSNPAAGAAEAAYAPAAHAQRKGVAGAERTGSGSMPSGEDMVLITT